MNKKRKQKSALGDLVKRNKYELLGLEDISASDQDIKRAFRKLSLIYHPDKYEEGQYDEQAKQKWLNLQEAYETLIDKEKRRIYDSTMEFDDWIPGPTLGEDEDFFDSYRAVFKRNAYWHVDPKKLHELGDIDTPYEKVQKFYKSWEAFKSWRDFTVEDEYDVMQAEDRYEKRWMEKQNRKMKEGLYKEERARIHRLIEHARANDPRVLKKEKEDREEKERIIREKQEEEERKKREEAERIQKEIDDKKKKKEAHKAKCNAFKDVLSKKLPKGSKYDKFWADEFLKK